MVARKAVEAKRRENWPPSSWSSLVVLVAAC